MRRIFVLLLGIGLIAPCAHGKPNSKNDWAQQNQYDQLQQEVQQLRGQVEELSFQLKKLQKQDNIDAMDTHAPKKQPTPDTKNLAYDSPATKSSSDKTTDSHAKKASNSSDDFKEAWFLIEQRNFAEAEVALTHFIKKYPKDPMIVNAYYWLGETYYNRSDYAQAALKFGEAYQAYLDHKNAASKGQGKNMGPDIIFKLASSLYNIGKYKDAKLTLDELQLEFPKLPANIRGHVESLRREIARKARSD